MKKHVINRKQKTNVSEMKKDNNTTNRKGNSNVFNMEVIVMQLIRRRDKAPGKVTKKMV